MRLRSFEYSPKQKSEEPRKKGHSKVSSNGDFSELNFSGFTKQHLENKSQIHSNPQNSVAILKPLNLDNHKSSILRMKEEDISHQTFITYLNRLDEADGNRAYKFLKRLITPKEDKRPRDRLNARYPSIQRITNINIPTNKSKSIFFGKNSNSKVLKARNSREEIGLINKGISKQEILTGKHKRFFEKLKTELELDKSIENPGNSKLARRNITFQSIVDIDAIPNNKLSAIVNTISSSTISENKPLKKLRRGTHTTLFLDHENFLFENGFNLSNFFNNLKLLISLVNNNQSKISNILSKIIFFFPNLKPIFFDGSRLLFMPYVEDEMRANLIEIIFGFPKRTSVKGILAYNKEALNDLKQAYKILEETMIKHEKISIHTLKSSILHSQNQILSNIERNKGKGESILIDSSYLSVQNGNFQRFSTQRETALFEQKLGKLDYLTERNRTISQEIDNSIIEIADKLVLR